MKYYCVAFYRLNVQEQSRAQLLHPEIAVIRVKGRKDAQGILNPEAIKIIVQSQMYSYFKAITNEMTT